MAQFKQFLSEELFKESNMGISRDLMPQVQSGDMDAFFKFMDDRGVTYRKRRVIISKLSPTQKEFSREKVDGMMKALSYERLTKKPLFVSKDMYVADGHHRWYAAKLQNPKGYANIWQVNLPIMEFLALFKAFPKTFYAGVNESADIDLASCSDDINEDTTVMSAAPTTQQPNASGEKKKDILAYVRKVPEEKRVKVGKLVDEIFESVDESVDVDVTMNRLATVRIVKK